MELIHSTEYMKYTLGDHHPTRPVRAENLLRLVHEAGLPHQPVEPTPAAREDLLLVHDLAYVEQVEFGWNHEWDGHRPWLHDVASLIVGGTVGGARRIIAGETARAFHPMGAKHHAMRDRASGFCIYNDMAIAAIVLADAGMRVLYVDWDAHHGDGVEFLLEDRQEIMTASIHNGQIFPGTGQAHRSGCQPRHPRDPGGPRPAGVRHTPEGDCPLRPASRAWPRRALRHPVVVPG